MSRSITGPSLLRWFAGLAGLAAVLGALVSLSIPLALHVVDRAGVPIGCGSAWHSDASTARREDSFNRQQHLLVSPQFVLSDYAGECDRTGPGPAVAGPRGGRQRGCGGHGCLSGAPNRRVSAAAPIRHRRPLEQ